MERRNYVNPNRQDAGLGSIALVLGGIGLGAALMYLFDPERGRGRRARLSDQLVSKIRRAGEVAESRARDLRNRARGVIHDVGSILPGGETNEQSLSAQNDELAITREASHTAGAGR